MKIVMMIILFNGYFVQIRKTGQAPIQIDLEKMADFEQATTIGRFGGPQEIGRTGYLGSINYTVENLISQVFLWIIFFHIFLQINDSLTKLLKHKKKLKPLLV